MFLALLPSPALAPYVHGYWFVQDLAGVYAGQPIHTSPHPGAVLSVNFGRPNAMEGGPTVAPVSLLGLQSVRRGWKSWTDTYFVMIMLSCPGLARLFPGLGPACADRLLDVSQLLGDRDAQSLALDLSAAWEPPRIARQLDRWLLRRLETLPAPSELPRLAAAYVLLQHGNTVQAAAAAVSISRRQLTRWFESHFGLAPKQIVALERLQSSLKAAQSGNPDPLSGYSDQAHQIRNWQRRLQLTPGRYLRSGPSPLAQGFRPIQNGAPAFYL